MDTVIDASALVAVIVGKPEREKNTEITKKNTLIEPGSIPWEVGNAFSSSQARQKLASVLKQAEFTGKVIIRRKDGCTFALISETIPTSPLDVPSVNAKVTTGEIVDFVREGRER